MSNRTRRKTSIPRAAEIVRDAVLHDLFRHARLGRGTFVIALVALLAALSMFFASAVDVHAMLTPEDTALRAGTSHEPVKMPEEWVWRGRPPVDLEYMYGNHEPPRQDYIVLHGTP